MTIKKIITAANLQTVLSATNPAYDDFSHHRKVRWLESAAPDITVQD